MGFDVKEYFPGVYHIGDAMGVCMTLLAGRHQAVLVDAGYGLESAGAAAASSSAGASASVEEPHPAVKQRQANSIVPIVIILKNFDFILIPPFYSVYVSMLIIPYTRIGLF